MNVFITICAADKDPAPGLLPALKRYRSDRIVTVASLARAAGADFRVLSGLYGLLAADDEIPYYDHLLTERETAAHVRLVTRQLLSLETSAVTYYSRPRAVDPQTAPYRAVMVEAARAACLPLMLVAFPPPARP